MRRRVAILGSGISGLLAAEAFEGVDVDLRIFDDGRSPETRGYADRLGHLDPIGDTKAFRELLDFYKLDFSTYSNRVGILLRDEIRPYPFCFERRRRDKDRKEVQQALAVVRFDLFTKSRGVSPLHLSETIDRETKERRTCLRFDLTRLAEGLRKGFEYSPGKLVRVTALDVTAQGEAPWGFDLCVMALPLWRWREIADYPVPEAFASRLNFAEVSPHTIDEITSGAYPDDALSRQAVAERWAPWDFVWTPYTPDQLVYAVSQHREGYLVHFGGAFEGEEVRQRLTNELNFFFQSGWYVKNLTRDTLGFCMVDDLDVAFPDTVVPLGRYAEWVQHRPLHRVYEAALSLRERF